MNLVNTPETMLYQSATYGEVDLQRIADIIKNDVAKNPESEFKISIGTDSQNRKDTKFVNVICVHRVGKGGYFFIHVSHQNKITDIAHKIFTEIQMSLDIAEAFTKLMIDIPLEIHVDVSTNRKGKTFAFVDSIISMVESCGYNCCIKPASPTASTIADRESK